MLLVPQKHAASLSPTRRRVKRALRRSEGYLYLLPAGLFLVAFMAYPVALVVQLSLQNNTAVTVINGPSTYVGLDNYAAAVADPTLQQAIWNTVVFTIWSMVFQIGIGVALALLYNQRFRGAGAMGILYLVVWVIPIVAAGAVARMLFASDGVVDWILQGMGLTNQPMFWLSDPRFAMIAVIAFNVWLGIPFNLLFLGAALKGIPDDLYEAACIDGAGRIARFRYITLPLLRPAILIVTVLDAIFTVKSWDVIWVTTQGGPVNATNLIITAAYRLVFRDFNFGEGSALLILLAVVMFALSVVYLLSVRHEEAS